MISVQVNIRSKISVGAWVKGHISTHVSVYSSTVCPILLIIDGGDSGDNSQYSPVNGLLDGGTA